MMNTVRNIVEVNEVGVFLNLVQSVSNNKEVSLKFTNIDRENACEFRELFDKEDNRTGFLGISELIGLTTINLNNNKFKLKRLSGYTEPNKEAYFVSKLDKDNNIELSYATDDTEVFVDTPTREYYNKAIKTLEYVSSENITVSEKAVAFNNEQYDRKFYAYAFALQVKVHLNLDGSFYTTVGLYDCNSSRMVLKLENSREQYSNVVKELKDMYSPYVEDMVVKLKLFAGMNVDNTSTKLSKAYEYHLDESILSVYSDLKI